MLGPSLPAGVRLASPGSDGAVPLQGGDDVIDLRPLEPATTLATAHEQVAPPAGPLPSDDAEDWVASAVATVEDGPPVEVPPAEHRVGGGAGEVTTAPARHDPGTPHEPGTLHDPEAVDALQQAHDRLRRTSPLRDVLDAVVDGLANGTGSDVALLRGGDESGWHVVAGSGLRTLEVRPLTALPPLLARLDEDSPVLTVAETDTVRGELAGLPLSRHRSLLVLRHPARLVTVLGRPQPYDQSDVDLVTRLMSAALPYLDRGWRTESLLLSLVDWFEGDGPALR